MSAKSSGKLYGVPSGFLYDKLTRFKKCETTYCDRTATKLVKIFLQEDEDKLGGWRPDPQKNADKLFDCGRGFGLVKQRKSYKLGVCKQCYEGATTEDFEFQAGDGSVKPIARVERI